MTSSWDGAGELQDSIATLLLFLQLLWLAKLLTKRANFFYCTVAEKEFATTAQTIFLFRVPLSAHFWIQGPTIQTAALRQASFKTYNKLVLVRKLASVCKQYWLREGTHITPIAVKVQKRKHNNASTALWHTAPTQMSWQSCTSVLEESKKELKWHLSRGKWHVQICTWYRHNGTLRRGRH